MGIVINRQITQRTTLTVEEIQPGMIVKRRGTSGVLMVGQIRQLKTSFEVDFHAVGQFPAPIIRTDWIFSGSKIDCRPGCWKCGSDVHVDGCGVCGRVAGRYLLDK